MNRPHDDSEAFFSTVMVRGVRRQCLGRRQIRRRWYFLLEEVGSSFRESYTAFDPLSGPGGNFFLVQSLPLNESTEQLLRVASRLKNDSFPRVVEWQKYEDRIDVASTWVQGINLEEYLRNIRNGRPLVDPSHAVRLMKGLVHGVSYLHRRMQVTHGDIQPKNVIVSSHPSRLHLIDFGSAWTTDWTTRRTEGDGQQRYYAAPELQFGQTVVSPACDVFSLSVILFELLTLELPYGGLGGKAGRSEYVSKAGKSLVPPSQLSESCRNLPRSLRNKLDEVVLRGLSFDPDTRFTSHNDWINTWEEMSIEFRVTPAMTLSERLITRVVEWMFRPRRDSTNAKS